MGQRIDELQEEHERDVVKTFLAWYNAKHRTAFGFVGRGDVRALMFRDGEQETRAVLSTAYFDMMADRLLWMPAPPRPVGPTIQTGFDFEKALVQCINEEIADRCEAPVSGRCVLIVSVHPTTTTATMLTEALNRVVLPGRSPFEGTYLAGHFARAKRMGEGEIDIRQLA